MQVDFTGLAIVCPHCSSPGRRQVRQCTPKVSGALTSLDPRWGRSPCSRDELAQRLFKTWLLGSQQRSRARDAGRRPLGFPDRSEVRNLNQKSRQRKQQLRLRSRFPLIHRCWIQEASSLAVPLEVHQSTKSNRSLL